MNQENNMKKENQNQYDYGQQIMFHSDQEGSEGRVEENIVKNMKKGAYQHDEQKNLQYHDIIYDEVNNSSFKSKKTQELYPNINEPLVSHLKQSSHQIMDNNDFLGPKDQSSSKDLQRQFEEVRFNAIQYNLMDLSMNNDEQNKQRLVLQGYNYEKFLEERVIHIQSPQLINDGYIMSYKLYQIKTKKENQSKYDTCVARRFSDFQYVNQQFIESYGGFIIPILPEKNFWATVNLEGKEYREIRTKSLQKYLTRLLKHKKLRLTKQVKSFLFQNDEVFSANKGDFTQKKNNIQDKIKTISHGALQYGKYFYNKILQLSTGERGSPQNVLEQQQLKLSNPNSSGISKMTKQDLSLGEYEIIITDLMRIIRELKILVQNTIEEIKRIDELKALFGFNVRLSQAGRSVFRSNGGISETIMVMIENDLLYEQYEELCQFIQSCSSAIFRRNQLKNEIVTLTAQEQSLTEKYKSSPRNYQLDIIRSKLTKLKKINITYTTQLIKQLETHADEGKGMLKKFIVNFQKIRAEFYAQGGNIFSETE